MVLTSGPDFCVETSTSCIAHHVQEKTNARLIAAAPDLLEIVSNSIFALEDMYGPDAKIVKEARAAIAKATGASE